MSLIYTQTVSVSDDSTSFTLTDTTGNYNAVTNPGGWGAPNPAKVNSYPFLQVYDYCSETYLNPVGTYLVTATTDPFFYPLLDGDHYISYNAGSPSQYPNYYPSTFDIPSRYGIPKMEDGIYVFTEKIIEEGESPYVASTYEVYVPVTNDIDCCIERYSNQLFSKDCLGSATDLWIEIIQLRRSFDYAMFCENYESACETIELLKTLCAQTECECNK